MATIQSGPHYEIPAAEFAKWLEQQAPDSWWNVDGDPLLTGRLSIPCPSDELAAELRDVNRPLLVEAKGDANARGQTIDASKIGSLARFAGNLQAAGRPQPWVNDRFFDLCWKGSANEWLLIEDSESAKQFLEDAAPKNR
ncbi:MAG: hypothetical protein U0793_06060 [Gemmataceae bacterium]